MRRLGAAVFALCAGFLSMSINVDPGSGVAHASETPNASDCIGFQKSELDKGLSYSIENVCERKLSCGVKWTLTCEDADGKTTAKTPGKAHVSLDASGSAAVTASADSCKQGWRIDEVSWSCK